MPEIILRRPKSDAKPTRWIALHWGVDYIDCRAWRVAKGKPTRPQIWTSLGGSTLWDFLANTVQGKALYVCAGWRIYEALCWAGMHGAIERGDIYLTQRKSYKATGNKMLAKGKLFGALICENPPTIIDVCMPEGGKVKFVDLRNFGLSPGMFAADNESQDIDTPTQAIEDYLCLLDELDLGQFKHTAAAQGFYCYRRSHMLHNLHADALPQARDLERQSYTAGRCEAYRLGKVKEQLYHYDVSAMYSSIGLRESFPTRLIEYDSHGDTIGIDYNSKKYHWIGECVIRTKEPIYPVRYHGRVVFPVGSFKVTLAWPELRYALKHDHVYKLLRTAKYEIAPIFAHWSEWYFTSLAKLQSLGLAHLKPALKTIVNATYGKFGQRSKEWADMEGVVAPFPWDSWWQRHPGNKDLTQWRTVDGLVQYLSIGKESPVALPAIASTICSYGRIHLWRLMKAAGRDHVLYCDTDGIIVDESGAEALQTQDYVKEGVAGMLRLREQTDSLDIFGIKQYLFGRRYCCAGVPDDAVIRENGLTEFRRHEPFQHGLWQKTAFVHEYKQQRIKRQQKYLHGKVEADGRIQPWLFGPENADSRGYTFTRCGECAYGILGSIRASPWQSDTTGTMPGG